MSKFAPIPNPLSHKDENKIDFILRPCAKFKYRYKGISEKDQAILYLKLRSESCPKFEANLFAAKPTCKVDSTKTFDGPSKCRVLKVKGNSNLTVNGWQFSHLKYDMGKNYYVGPEEFMHVENEYDQKLEKNFRENEKKINNDFKIKIENLRRFYSDINQKYDFHHLQKNQLSEKLKKLKLNFIDGKDKNSLSGEASSIILDNADISLIQKFKIFDNENSITLTKPEKPENKKPVSFSSFDIEDHQNKSKEISQNHIKLKTNQIKIIPDSPKNDINEKKEKNKESPQAQKHQFDPSHQNLDIFHNLEGSRKNSVDSLSEAENIDHSSKSNIVILDQSLKNKSILFRDLEDQNKFIEEINNSNIEDFYKFKKFKKKKTICNLMESSSKHPEVIPILRNVPKKEVIANEFNQANYMFFNDESKEAKMKTRNERKLRLIKMGILEDLKQKIERPKKKLNKTTSNLNPIRSELVQEKEKLTIAEIKKEMQFQRTLRNFIKLNINFQNTRPIEKFEINNSNLLNLQNTRNKYKNEFPKVPETSFIMLNKKNFNSKKRSISLHDKTHEKFNENLKRNKEILEYSILNSEKVKQNRIQNNKQKSAVITSFKYIEKG